MYFGYFAGRAFGGPKLLPAVSPKKTWSGAIAGCSVPSSQHFCRRACSALQQIGNRARRSCFVGRVAIWRICLNCGIKRQFGAKDSGHLIPGHGGVMDRLDGFWAAALVGCIIGLMRGGFDAPARGLLLGGERMTLADVVAHHRSRPPRAARSPFSAPPARSARAPST